MKPISLAPLLVVLSACGRDAPAPAEGPGASPATAGAAAAPQGCPGLASHWREVWKAETRPGLERRADRAAELAAAAWTRACAEVASSPPSAADIEAMRGIKSFAALQAMDAAAAKGALAALLKAAQGSAQTTALAFDAAPPSGVVECEDALASAAFCGDDVDKASVRSAAKGKDDGACAALQVLLAKKCVP